MNILAEYSLRPSIVIFGVPLSGRNNPIYVALLDNYVKVFIVEKNGDCIKSPHVNEIIDILGEELGEDLKLTVCLEKPLNNLPYLSHYSILTSALSLFLSELLELDVKDITESLMGIETELFERELIQLIQASRLSIISNKPLMYRYGEEPVIIENPRTCYISTRSLEVIEKDNRSFVYRIEDVDNELSDLVTKIAGLTVIKAYSSIHGKSNDILLNICCRIENMLWYAEYGFNPPMLDNDYCIKWIPNIGKPIQALISFNIIGEHNKWVEILC